MTYTTQEIYTLLAGLRALQLMRVSNIPVAISNIETDSGAFTPLSDDSLERLCEKITKNSPPNVASEEFLEKHQGNIKNPPDDNAVLCDSTLSTRIKNVLSNESYKTVGDLKNLSRYKFTSLPNAGKKGLHDLEMFLGRALSSARFEEISGEAYTDRRIRLAKWWDEN